MTIKTKRWNDDIEVDDGFRLLVCRYRPRAVRKDDEVWSAWWYWLGPSRQLHRSWYDGRLTWAEYRSRYLEEMRTQRAAIENLSARVSAGETMTLLCSSACVNAGRCHRTLLKELVARAARRFTSGAKRSHNL